MIGKPHILPELCEPDGLRHGHLDDSIVVIRIAVPVAATAGNVLFRVQSLEPQA
jgi:hypothetical protein